MLGGGADFSSGGPGKGMHSRLYSQVLAKNGWVTSCNVYNNTFEHTGLFGIMLSTPDVSRGAQLVDLACLYAAQPCSTLLLLCMKAGMALKSPSAPLLRVYVRSCRVVHECIYSWYVSA
jgi:hypothetical protein